jgi:hypothetical protein
VRGYCLIPKGGKITTRAYPSGYGKLVRGNITVNQRPTFTLVIPCHKDCDLAYELEKTFDLQIVKPDHVVIAHNGCSRADSYSFSSKAKAINTVTKTILDDYVLVVDADMKLAPTCLEALSMGMSSGIDVGSSTIIKKDGDRISLVSVKTDYNGGIWFARTNIIKEVLIPEDIVTEDTAYILELKKLKKDLRIENVDHAVAYEIQEVRNNFMKLWRQSVRYHLGRFQLMRKHLGTRAAADSIAEIFLTSIAFLLLLVFTEWFLRVPSITYFGIYLISGIDFARQTKHRLNALLPLVDLSSPFIAFALFLMRRKIW